MGNDPEHIRNWQRLTARITTSGQPREAELDDLAAIGVATVINLGLHGHAEALPDERASLARRGIAYAYVPVPFDAPDETHYAAFRDALERAGEAAVHVHCIMNYRVSAFFYRWHRERGVPEAEARALLERQWAPDRGDRPEARPWARFIAPWGAAPAQVVPLSAPDQPG